MYRVEWSDDRLGERFDSVDHRFDEVNRRFDKVEHEINRLHDRFDGLYRAMYIVGGGMIAALLGVIATQL